MRSLLTIAASAALFSTLAFADTWAGRLVDANCTNQDKAAKECNAGSGTTAFLLVYEGKTYPLDEAGNQKAVQALKTRADRAADPNDPKASQIMAKVTGAKEGSILKVETIEIQ